MFYKWHCRVNPFGMFGWRQPIPHRIIGMRLVVWTDGLSAVVNRWMEIVILIPIIPMLGIFPNDIIHFIMDIQIVQQYVRPGSRDVIYIGSGFSHRDTPGIAGSLQKSAVAVWKCKLGSTAPERFEKRRKARRGRVTPGDFLFGSFFHQKEIARLVVGWGSPGVLFSLTKFNPGGSFFLRDLGVTPECPLFPKKGLITFLSTILWCVETTGGAQFGRFPRGPKTGFWVGGRKPRQKGEGPLKQGGGVL